MFPAHEIIEYLFECHGGTIDVTFTPVAKQRIKAFLQDFRTKYRIESATDNQGKDCVDELVTNKLFASNAGFVHVITTAEHALIKYVQLFIDWEQEKDKFCLEISFFPQDFDRSLFSLSRFQAEVDHWQSLLLADDYFVRQENASWKLYDSHDLGVIYTRSSRR